ncbi:MAG: M23 family metallopeptidase [Isosphaeraceae bacterium]
MIDSNPLPEFPESHSPKSAPLQRRRDFLRIPVYTLVVSQTLFRVIPEFRPGMAGVVCWLFGLELVPLFARIILGLALVSAAFRRPFWTKRRVFLWGLLVLLALSDALFARYPSSFDGRPSRVPFRVPLDGPVTVGWGGGTPSENYHVVAPDQRWAYDLLVTQNGQSHKGEGQLLTDYHIYDMKILSPCDGEVVAVFKDDPDMPVGELGGGTTPAGNHVVLKVSPDEYLWLCHLRPRSALVRQGDRVKRGDPLGRVGNSGNTSEPHLHIHLQNTPLAGFAEGIPLPFHDYKTADGRFVEKGIPTGGIGPDGSLLGQVIENASLVPADSPKE